MKYGILNQQNAEYKPGFWQKLDDLYVGGWQILERVKKYIPRQVNEDDDRYNERLSLASYINYLGLIIDRYAGNLFASEPTVVPAPEKEGGPIPDVDEFWKEFAKNANLGGESFAALLKCVFTHGILFKRAHIALDFPASDIYPESRAEEDSLGNARAYAFELTLQELTDWEYSEIVTRKAKIGKKDFEFTFGKLKWAIIKRRVARRDDPLAPRDTFVEQFRVWTLGADRRAQWALFETDPRTEKDPAPKDDDDIKEISRGPTSWTEIPILEFCVPNGLWMGNLLGPLALHLFRRRSALDASENRSLFPVPVVNLGREIPDVGGALPADVQMNPGRGNDAVKKFERKGAVILGADDKFGFAEPKGDIYKIVHEQISGDVDELFRIASLMAGSISNTSSALGRSGTSKEQDHRDMIVVLTAYSILVKDLAQRVYDVIGEARKDEHEWRVHGLDKLDVADRASIIEEAKALPTFSIPSKTFKVQMACKTAVALLGNVTPEMEETIRSEIEKGVAHEEELKELMLVPGDEGDGDEEPPVKRGNQPQAAKPGAGPAAE